METLCLSGISSLGSIAAGSGGRRQPDQTVRRRAKAKALREEKIMTSKLAFRLDDTNEPDRYVIRLIDRKQIAALAQSEGLSTRIPLQPVAVLYDGGSGELVPVDGFDDATPQGRIAMRIMAEFYSDVLDRIAARVANCARTGNEIRRNAA
jgi:hypothetical protein